MAAKILALPSLGLIVAFIVFPVGWMAHPARGAAWTPDPSLGNPDLHRRLYDIGRRYGDLNFDPDANMVGVHSKHPPNKKSHSTRESAYYAYGLLLTGDPADRQRAQKILLRVVGCQDTKPGGVTYGAFNWNAEDLPGDLNSAAFVGLTLADVIDLDRHHPCLDPDVRTAVEKSARLAVQAVMRRDVDPGYTNIALLSIALASGGEKLLAEPGAGQWAEKKLDAVMALSDDGEFAEYLSPTYTGVAMQGAYMAQKLAFSDAFSAKAQSTIDHLWKQVALSYHAPTCQLAGPYLRAYGDNMLDYAAVLKYFLYVGLNGNYPLSDADFEHDWDMGCLPAVADLPISPRPEFDVPPPTWRQWDAVATPPTPVRHLTQYREGNFVLGTVAYQDEWKQKRNLVAFWRNDGPPPLGFSLGHCIDESNESIPGFAGEKLHFYCEQKKSAALVAIVGSTDVPGQGVSTLVFDDAATMADKGDASPVRIQDGTITTYLYPVALSPVTYKSETDAPHHVMRVTRSWNSSDIVGDLHVMAYLIVFKPAGQPAPDVSGIELKAGKTGVTASGKVDGDDLSVTFQN